MNLSLILSRFGIRKEEDRPLSTSVIKGSISQVTIADYKKIVFENDLSSLIVSGSPSQEDLTEAKSSLLYEFSIATGAEVSNPILNSYRKIHLCKNKIAGLSIAQNMVVTNWNDEVTAFLRDINVKIYPLDIEKTIKNINRKIKSLQVQLKEEENRYKGLISNNGPSSVASEEDFERQISMIGKYMGFRIDKDTTYLSEYAAFIYGFKKELEHGSAGKRH